MKKILFMCTLIILVGFGTANAAQITFDLDPMGDIMLGDSLTMDIFSTGWTSAAGLVGGTVFVSYDPTVLKVTSASVTEPDFGVPRLYWDTKSETDSGTQVRLGFSNLAFPTVTSDFMVGMILFEAIGVGTSGLILTTENFVAGGQVVPFEGSSGSVNVNAVPIPSTIILLGGGLIGLIGLRRRRS